MHTEIILHLKKKILHFHYMKKKYTTPEYRLNRLRSQALLESSPFDNRYYQNQADIRYSSDYVSAEEAD